ncbi:MAG: hypothetical protein U9Q07_04515 [Planctomycetota bacterium]|nr:hypothetical protein [Planctomycetota bacterium]
MKKARKEIERIKKEISKLDKPAEKDSKEEAARNSDEAEGKKDNVVKDKKKDREKRSKLNLDLRSAELEIEKIQEVIDEPMTYADLPKDTRENMIRKIYVSNGKYTVEVKSDKESHSTTLQVGSGNTGERGRSR